MPELSIEERVAAGAGWLDANRPGWTEHMRLDLLDVSDCEDCVLGQEFGYYELAPVDIRLGPTSHDLGFDARMDEGVGRYGRLTDEWRRVILSRREAVSSDGR